MDPWKRRFLLETIISRFHVNFWGCNPNKQKKQKIFDPTTPIEASIILSIAIFMLETMPELNSVPAARPVGSNGGIFFHRWGGNSILPTKSGEWLVGNIYDTRSSNLVVYNHIYHIYIYIHILFSIMHLDFLVAPYQSLILPKKNKKINSKKHIHRTCRATKPQLFFRFFLVTDLMSILGILVIRKARNGDQGTWYLIYSSGEFGYCSKVVLG